jgi:putative DNA primase/helicase
VITGNPPDILSRLDGVRKTAGGWQARCPAHDDQTASLSVSIGDDGRVLLHDHAGCEPAAVVRALGLEMKDLMPQRDAQDRQRAPFQIDRAYDYRDESGELLYQAVRLVPKDFRQRRPDGNGGWAWGVKGVRLVPYNLPALKAAAPGSFAFVPEGEKDGDRLTALELLATCNVGGAGKWRDEYAEHLAGLHVVVLADNDDPGRKHAQQVAASVCGKAASVKILQFDCVPEKGDVSDWLDAGHTKEELLERAAAAPEWKPTGKAKRKRERAPITITAESLNVQSAAARTDIANARRFALCCGDDVRWCDPWQKWLAWDGRRWSLDSERRIDALGKQVADAVWLEVAALLPNVDFATGKELTSFARSTASARGISNMLALAKSEPGVPILPRMLDTDQWVFNCANGTLDLRTGKLRPHNRGDLLTKVCPVKYDPAATCPNWLAMLDVILGPQLAGYIQRAVGYSLTGSVQEQCLFLLYGLGSNGKSTFLDGIMRTFGKDFSMQAADGLLMAKGGETHPTERADLFGMRFVSSVEVEEGRRLNESLAKQLTGGDMIRARRMREDFWEFPPTHKLWMAANHKPVIRGTDHGIWRRVKLVPFIVTIADDEQDKDLPRKLLSERDGILAWAVRGCLEWQSEGLGEPVEITEATAEYRSEMDVVGAFIADCCATSGYHSTRSALIYESYQNWCKANGEFAVNQRRFGLAMTERGFERYKNNGVFYRGIELLTEQTEPYGTNF